jgi:hypothetical protein
MKALRDNGQITNEIFMVQTYDKTQVVKFGGYDEASIEGELDILEC